MFTKAFNAIFMTRPFWNEVNVPQSLVLKIYKEYLGTKNMIITSRAESIKYISPIVNRLQREILDWIKSTNTNQVIKDLYQIFDKCFRLYITEKEARKQLVDLNISDDDILDAFNCNRNMAVNVLNAVNLWLENAVLYQNEADPAQISEDSTADSELFVKLYLYGLTSKALSLLSLSRKFKEKELFYGINLSFESNEPIDVIRYHPVIYYNPALTGNQDAFNLTVDDYKQVDRSVFGIGFQKEHGLSFLLSIYRQELVSVEGDIVAYSEKVKRIAPRAGVRNSTQYDAYCSSIESVLKSWGFPGEINLSFDNDTLDLYINEKSRSDWGKGYRAFIMSAMVVGLMRYCCENDRPHPGFVIIDSPLVSLKERKKVSDEWINDYMEKSMIEDIHSQDSSRQVIFTYIPIAKLLD